jgi:hypothetical protein
MGSGVTPWEMEEDEALARSWVAASEDSITKARGRLFEIFVGIIPDGKERTSTACMARWGTMNQDVTKFWGLFA